MSFRNSVRRPHIYYVSVPLSMLEERIDLVVREGFHPEVRMTRVDYLMSLQQADVERMRRLLEERALSVFTHGPFFGLDIASLDRHISEYSEASFARGLEVTAALGGDLMVVHTGFLPQYSRGGRRHWFRNWSSRMPRIIERSRELGVRIALENTWDDKPEIILHLLDLLPGPGAGVCLDTGHLNAYSRLGCARWWDMLGERVVALHLHDNDGLSDDHLPPGRGTFEFEVLADRLRGCKTFPLMDLEVEITEAAEGRTYLEGLFSRG